VREHLPLIGVDLPSVGVRGQRGRLFQL